MINGKFVRKYMRMAKQVGEDCNPCYSRKIGVVIVDPVVNKVMGIGYNGPPKDTPHCDSPTYMKNVVWPQLSTEEKLKIAGEAFKNGGDEEGSHYFVHKHAGCGQCPRKLLGFGPGERSSICSCQHAERNAITNSRECLYGAFMFCWCGVPCDQCTGAIINADIQRVYCLKVDGPDYSQSSRFLLRHAGVELVILTEEDCLDECSKENCHG